MSGFLQFKRAAKTDEEYVETVRNQLRQGKKVAIISMVFAVVISVGLIWLLPKFFELVGAFGKDSADKDTTMTWAGFVVGILIGFFFGVVMHKAVKLFMNSLTLFRGDRTQTLLIKYHDLAVGLAEGLDKGEEHGLST